MKRFNITVTKPINYHFSIEAATFEDAEKEVRKRSLRNMSKDCYATSEGELTVKVNSEEDLTPKQYKCRIYRCLTQDIILDATSEQQAIDMAIDQAGDMEDCDFDGAENDAEVLEIIYTKKEDK